MLKVKLFSLMPFLISCLFLSGAEWKVDPQKSVIIIPGKAVNPVRSAALELQKHFRLITGKEVSVQEGGKGNLSVLRWNHTGGRPEHSGAGRSPLECCTVRHLHLRGRFHSGEKGDALQPG